MRVHGRQIVGVGADHGGAAVVDQVLELLGGQPEVDRHQHRADLRHGVERLELRVGVGRDVGDAVALDDAEGLQRRATSGRSARRTARR